MPSETAQESPELHSLKSRKFILTVLAKLITLYLIVTGKLTSQEGMQYIVYLTGIYVVGEAFGDGKLLGGSNMGEVLKAVSGLGDLVKKNGDAPGATPPK